MRCVRLTALLVTLVTISIPTCAFGQLLVDCSGTNPNAYPTIKSVIPYLTNWDVVQVSGTCQENVWITGSDNLTIRAPSGQTANLQGQLSIVSARHLTIQGLNVTNPGGTGISINSSDVELDNCTSSNNGGAGLSIGDSSVTVQNGGAFNNNGFDGISVGGASNLGLGSWLGPGTISISNNVGDGIYLEDGVMAADGGVTISNNKAVPGYNPFGSDGAGFGINVWGHGRGYVLSSWAPDTISGNQAGGVAVHEGSEFVLGAFPTDPNVAAAVIVDRNGPIGVSAGLGSQVSLWSGVQITNHADVGVDVYGSSQVIIDGNQQQGGSFQIANNGTGPASTYPARAGVRVDGNSEAYIRAGQIAQNGGPGILALTNSSIDLSGATFTSNSGGAVACDSSSWLVTDQLGLSAPRDRDFLCKVPNQFGPRHSGLSRPPFRIPDSSQMKGHWAQ